MVSPSFYRPPISNFFLPCPTGPTTDLPEARCDSFEPRRNRPWRASIPLIARNAAVRFDNRTQPPQRLGGEALQGWGLETSDPPRYGRSPVTCLGTSGSPR